jgi:hypothetical protein
VAVDSIEDQWLWRFWVNGRPFVPDEVEEIFKAAEKQQTRLARRLRLELRDVPPILKAKSGDRIGVQLLWCPDGWERTGLRERLLRKTAERDRRDEVDCRPRLTERVEFVAP